MTRSRSKIEKEMGNAYDSAASHATVELLLDIRDLLEQGGGVARSSVDLPSNNSTVLEEIRDLLERLVQAVED